LGLAALFQAALALASGGTQPPSHLPTLTPRQKAALVVVSGLPAPKGVAGVLVQAWSRSEPRPRHALVFADQEGGEASAFGELPPGRPAPSYTSRQEAADAGFDTGTKLAADDIAGIIVVNGWRNVIYLASGLLALAFAPRHARRTAAALAGFYLVYGVWGLTGTDHDIGNILEVLPLTDEDNVLHLVIGGLGAIAALADGPLPGLPRRKPRPKRRRRRSGADEASKPAAKPPASSRSRA